MITLYEMTEKYQELLNCGEEEDISEALRGLEGEITEKVANGIGLIQTLKMSASGMEQEIKRLQERKKVLERRIEQIQQYYLENLKYAGLKKVQTARGSMTVARSGGKKPLKIDDEELIPLDFKRVISSAVIDKDAVREALERGIEVAGAHLEERGQYLKIS